MPTVRSASNGPVQQAGTKVRNGRWSVTRRLMELGKATRGRGAGAEAREQKIYRRLIGATRQVAAQAEAVAE